MCVIRCIEVRNYRALENFVWQPNSGINVLLGPGDSGKTTLLSALNLFERRPRQLLEFDYYCRRTADGFDVTIVVTGLAISDFAAERQQLPIRGWKGGLVSLAENGAEAALVLRAAGTPELDLEYSIISESGDAYQLTSRLRSQLNVLTLTRTDDASRDFRGSSSSLLSKNFGEANLAQAARAALQHAVTSWADPEEAKTDLEAIKAKFREHGLPHELLLGIVPPSGVAASQSVTAFSGTEAKESIPFELAGDGTRQLSTLVLASRLLEKAPILLIDELEAGLEPHRQRVAAKLVRGANNEYGQTFIVTHAPAVVGALADAHHWQMTRGEALHIPASLTSSIFKMQPEAAFAQLSLVCEGKTERGLVRSFWSHYVKRDVEECGVVLIDGGGQEQALKMLSGLIAAHLPCAGFLDNEPTSSGTRSKIKGDTTLFTWDPLRMPEEALARWIPFEKLTSLLEAICTARSKYSKRYPAEMLIAQVAKALTPTEHRRSLTELRDAYNEDQIRDGVYKVLCDNALLKIEEVASDVASWLICTGIPPEMDDLLGPFFAQCSRNL
jgi:putative ATP-dependent endonuclease of OLD family